MKNKPCTNYSIFEYQYRDACNYKAWGEILLQGNHSPTDAEKIKDSCDWNNTFVAEQLEIPTLYEELYK